MRDAETEAEGRDPARAAGERGVGDGRDAKAAPPRFERWLQELESLEEVMLQGCDLRRCVVQGLDLRSLPTDWSVARVEEAIFLGCRFRSIDDELLVRSRGATVFPRFEGLPYDPYRSRLYTWQELYRGWTPERDDSTDLRIYRHFERHGRHFPDIREALAQRVHDHAIDNALHAWLGFEDDESLPQRRAVGVMGGHGARRDSPTFELAARLGRLLSDAGYVVVTGGGPGVMEAANLGAWLSTETESELGSALEALARAPGYRDPAYVEAARTIHHHYRQGVESLAVPTWFYGHEPSNLFSTAIAKYFSNSIREDGLLAISLYGVVFAPGSAGTTQEVFLDAVQNHYATYHWRSPMVFLGQARYRRETLIYPLIEQLAEEGGFGDMILLTDEPEEAVEFLRAHPPRHV